MATAIVPLKPSDQAKTRLITVLSAQERAHLAVAMARDTLEVLHAHPSIDRIIVVGSDDGTHAIATEAGAEFWNERSLRAVGLNPVLEAALKRINFGVDEPVLMLHADLPLLDHDDITAALATLRSSTLVIGCDRHGSGTNLIAFNAQRRPYFVFGPDSCFHYQRGAKELGGYPQILFRRGISFDIDLPVDIETLRRETNDNRIGRHTTGWLERSAMSQMQPGNDVRLVAYPSRKG